MHSLFVKKSRYYVMLSVFGLMLIAPGANAAEPGDPNWVSQFRASETVKNYDPELSISGDSVNVPIEDKWSLKLNAGQDLTRAERAEDIHGEDYRDSWRFGVGVNYKF